MQSEKIDAGIVVEAPRSNPVGIVDEYDAAALLDMLLVGGEVGGHADDEVHGGGSSVVIQIE